MKMTDIDYYITRLLNCDYMTPWWDLPLVVLKAEDFYFWWGPEAEDIEGRMDLA